MDMVFATLIGNFIMDAHDPLWTMIIGPSSGGKTTLIAPCCSLKTVHFIDDLTEKSLLSGYKVKGKEMSLLSQIGNGIMAFSDFTTILSKNPLSKGEILTQLKMVYDGKFTKHTGTGKISWEGKMGLIAASTPDIYSHLEAGRSMGERFLYYWLEQPTDEEVAQKQQDTQISSKDITNAMKHFYEEYYNGIAAFVREKGLPKFSLTDEQKRAVRDAAIFCVNGKATVHTDFKSGKVDQIPNKAGVGRDNKTFDTLLHTLQLMDAYESDNFLLPVSDERIRLIEKCAYSSINRERRKILEILVAQGGKAISASDIGAKKGLGMERDSVEKYLIPLHAVGMIRKKVGNPHTWYIDDEATISFVNRVSPSVKEEEIVEASDVMEADSAGFSTNDGYGYR